MTSITEIKAKALGMVPKTNYYRATENDMLQRMFKDIKQRNPEAQIVQGNGGKKIIYVKASKALPRQDNPKALRGKYPPIKDVVGTAKTQMPNRQQLHNITLRKTI